MRIPVTGSLSDWLPPLPKPDTSPYELNPRNIGTSKTLKSPKTTSNAEDYRAARKAIAARKSKPAPAKQSSGGGGFGGLLGPSLAGSSIPSMGGGGSNPYLDVLNGLGKDDKTFEDYMSEANKIYKPSLDYLTSQETNTTKRAGQFDKDLAGMYEALVGNIRGQSAGINQNYNGAISQQGQITDDAKTAVGNNYSQAQAQQAAMLKQLGIEEAAPATLQQGQDSQAFFQSLLDSQGAGYNQFLNSEKAASQQFNTAQGNIAAQTGTNARADLKMQLQDILGQLAGKKADLKTQINQQAIQMQSGAAQSMMDQAKMMMDAIRYNNSDQMDQANLQLGYDRLAQQQETDRGNLEARLAELQEKSREAAAKANSPASAKAPSDPWGRVSQVAGQIYPNSTAAGNAVKAVQDAIAMGTFTPGMGKNSSDLLRAVLQRVSPSGDPNGRDVTDRQQLQTLVDYLYKQMFS